MLTIHNKGEMIRCMSSTTAHPGAFHVDRLEPSVGAEMPLTQARTPEEN
jgi:hypothetical protein